MKKTMKKTQKKNKTTALIIAFFTLIFAYLYLGDVDKFWKMVMASFVLFLLMFAGIGILLIPVFWGYIFWDISRHPACN